MTHLNDSRHYRGALAWLTLSILGGCTSVPMVDGGRSDQVMKVQMESAGTPTGPMSADEGSAVYAGYIAAIGKPVRAVSGTNNNNQ